MQLPDQLLKKLRLLIDKPISPKVNKQLLPLLLHQNLQVDKAIPALLIKYRCDLLNHMLQNDRYPNQSTKNSMLLNILTKILEYKIAQILQLYILLLTKMDDDKKMLELGYYDLIKLGIKQPNLQIKQKLFQIILSNCEYFYKRKCKKVVMAIFANYLQVFQKFLIYVPSYISIMELGLEIDKNSKMILNKEHPERQLQLEQIFIDFSSQQLSIIKNQIINILQNSKEKLNYYSLHRNCLNALKKIGDIINQFKVKESELHFTQLEVGQICRVIQIFIDRKGTIDEAKFAKIVWIKRFNELKKIKQLKSQKYMNIPSEPSLILDKKQAEKPLLIEQVISMANNYRLKYQVSPNQNQQSSPSRIMAVSNNFLKKGIGVGGGRTYLLNQKHQSVFRDEKQKNKRIYDGIVNKCFNQCQKELEYKSFVVPKKNYQQQPKYVQNQLQIQTPIKNNRNNQISQLQQHINTLTNKQQKKYPSHIYQNSDQILERTVKSSIYEEDEEIQEINNLIQLAYSYKFS